MKIIQLQAENIKRLTTVEITPDGNLVQICGRNGSGKTSVLDSIMWALEGAKAVQSKPIRRGQTHAKIRLQLGGPEGDLIVTRKFAEGKATELLVENAEGARYPSGQAMLDKLLGTISFDPLAFSRMKPREQFDTLRDLVKCPVDFDKLDALNRGDFARRADINKEAKQLRAQVEGYKPFAEDLPELMLDTTAIVDEIGKVGEHNAAIDRKREARERMKEKIEGLLDDARLKSQQAAKLRADAEELEQASTKMIAEANKIDDQLVGFEPLPAPANPAEVKARLAAAEETNREIRRRGEKATVLARAVEKEKLADELTEKMNAREKEKKDAIEAAKMPVDGIGFGEGQVLLAGVPFEQASSAEQLRASTAIAMAMSPKLRVIRITDGSLLDEASMKLLEQMAELNDFQIWIERVDTSGKVGIVMVDGHTVDANAEKSNKEAVSA